MDWGDTAAVPRYLNNMNRAEPEIYVDKATCDYIVDIDLPSVPLQPLAGFSEVKEAAFLDSAMTRQPFRSFWIPGG